MSGIVIYLVGAWSLAVRTARRGQLHTSISIPCLRERLHKRGNTQNNGKTKANTKASREGGGLLARLRAHLSYDAANGRTFFTP